MADKLNLLPSDYAVSGPVSKFLKIVRPFNVILLSVFLVGTLGMTAFLILSSVQLKELGTANSNLKAQIQSLQNVQQQIVLLKDRLGKIKVVIAAKQAEKNIREVNPFFQSISAQSAVNDVEVVPEKAVVTMGFTTNSDLVNFVSVVSGQSSFSSVILDTFGYAPATGYTLGFTFIPKN